MSTRCQIGIYPTDETPINKPEILLYRHSDGYPEGVLPDIMPFLADFKKVRGLSDTEYLGAQLIAYMAHKDLLDYPGSKYLGYGICGNKELHGDIEFFYRITPKAIYVYSVAGETYASMRLEDTKIL